MLGFPSYFLSFKFISNSESNVFTTTDRHTHIKLFLGWQLGVATPDVFVSCKIIIYLELFTRSTSICAKQKRKKTHAKYVIRECIFCDSGWDVNMCVDVSVDRGTPIARRNSNEQIGRVTTHDCDKFIYPTESQTHRAHTRNGTHSSE